MPFGTPLDDLTVGEEYEIYLIGKPQPMPCIYRGLLAERGTPARLVLKPLRSLHAIRLSVKDIEAIQPREGLAHA